MDMNIRRIIKEEIDDFDWVDTVNTDMLIDDIKKLLPGYRIELNPPDKGEEFPYISIEGKDFFSMYYLTSESSLDDFIEYMEIELHDMFESDILTGEEEDAYFNIMQVIHDNHHEH